MVAEPIGQEPLEDHADGRCLLLLDQQLAVLQPVAERDIAAHPHALLARGGELVADALADHLALELGEGEQDVQRQPAHGGGGVEGLGHRDEGDVVGVEHLDQLGEIHERARQPVDLVDDHDIDQPASISRSSRFKAGRSSVAPEMPPSS